MYNNVATLKGSNSYITFSKFWLIIISGTIVLTLYVDGDIKISTNFLLSLEFRTSKCSGSILNALGSKYTDSFEVGFNNKVGSGVQN